MQTCAEFDVAVLGAGPAGAAVAISLAKAKRRVVLLDYASAPDFVWGESLPPAANPLLCELGVSQEMMGADHLRSCGTRSAWGESVVHDNLFIRHPRGQGWHLNRTAFDARLRSVAVQNGARLLTYAGQLSFQRQRQGFWKLVVNGPQEWTIKARWIVDCSGRRSWLASRLGAKRIHFDRLVAIGGLFKRQGLPVDEDSATLVEAAPDGWWYTLRMPNDNRIVVYVTHPGRSTMQLARTESGFLGLLSETNHVRRRLEECGYTLDNGPMVAVANSSRLEVLWGDGWTAAGDAGMAFDPVSSQGVFNALYSGVRAAQAVSAALSGDLLALDRYVHRLDAVFAEYMINRRLVYSLERRWSNGHFWQTALSVGHNAGDGALGGSAKKTLFR